MVKLIPSKEQMEQALIKRYGAALYKKISSASVAVCGLGGLGSNIACLLARAGVGRLLLIDFDRVDITNLNRQQYRASQIGMLKTQAICENLKETAPYTKLEAYNERIDEHNAVTLLKNADIICEAFDAPEAKAALTNTVLEIMPEKYLVAASGMAGLGSANSIKTRRITDKFYLCGDGESDVFDGLGILSSRVMLCAAHQAHAVVRIIAGEFDI